MHESNTALVVGNDVEVWSICRTSRGFSCLRTVYAGSAPAACSAIAASRWRTSPDEPDAAGVVADSVPLSRPTASAGCSVTRPAAAVSFFAGEGSERLLERAQRLVGEVAPLLHLVGTGDARFVSSSASWL
jgi:hypothetical protein